MDGFQNILISVVFILEVVLLAYLEMKAWKTIYTPLNFLMFPYAFILLLSILISGNFGFVEFYYPSVVIWCCGLLLFAMPSQLFAFILQKHQINLKCKLPTDEKMPKLLAFISAIIILLFMFRLYSMLGSSHNFASEEFGEEFAGRGFWGHLRQLSLPILIIAIYYVNSKNAWLWLIIIPILFVAILYNVKGWVIIPCLSGIMLRICMGKTKLRFSVILGVVLGAIIFFAGSYILTLTVAGDSELGEEVLFFIFRNIVHYLTSGVLGLSVDMQKDFPDAGGFELLIAQFINIGRLFTGDSEMLSAINPLFYNTGVNLTNVRTMFGTIFINSSYLTFIVYILTLSSSIYLLKLATLRFNNIFLYAAYFLECGFLFMGWFDSYFYSLSSVEIPLLSLMLMLLCKIFAPKEHVNNDFKRCN